MLFDIQKHSQHAREFLREVAKELGTPDDMNHAGRVFTSVMHSFRDMFTPEESLQMISQLPLYVRAVYIDGWKIGRHPRRLKRLDDFLNDVQFNCKNTASRDFGTLENTKREVEAVFRVIKRHVSEGEIKDVKSQLPTEIQELISQ